MWVQKTYFKKFFLRLKYTFLFSSLDLMKTVDRNTAAVAHIFSLCYAVSLCEQILCWRLSSVFKVEAVKDLLL